MAKIRQFSVGRHTYGIDRSSVRFSGGAVTVGSFCSVASGVTIFAGGNHRTEWVTTFPFPKVDGWEHDDLPEASPAVSKGDVWIGSDVWIGQEALILSGVTIGHGAVIGARAVVSRDVPPFAIVAGNPARVRRYRFPEDVRQALLDIAWWEWTDRRIRKYLPLLCGDPAAFIARVRS